MSGRNQKIDSVRASRAGHTFHERWAARRALQLIFPKDNLFAVVVEGLSPIETLQLGQEAEDIADLTLFYGRGETFKSCSAQQILQFKYKKSSKPVTSSYLKKTIKKFAATLREFKKSVSSEELDEKLSFGFVTNAEFSSELWDAISSLKSGRTPTSQSAKNQLRYLSNWCQQENIDATELFPSIEFRASTKGLAAQNRSLRRTVSDWSSDSEGQAAKRLFSLTELVREKSETEGQGRNSIRREDILDALECDEDQLFPADTQFVDIGDVVERDALKEMRDQVATCVIPVVLHADGGVGKTVFIQSLVAHLSDTFESVVFDCFGGGAYRSAAQARHLPKVGLLQIVNEFAVRGLCDPMLPSDSDRLGLIYTARKRLQQASSTVINQSGLKGVLIVIDAADNAQLVADERNEDSFPKLLLASLSHEPIDGVKLVLTTRPHRKNGFIGENIVMEHQLRPFTEKETKRFLDTRKKNISEVEFSTAFARSQGNARVLEYLVESWETNVSGDTSKAVVSVSTLIEQKCVQIDRDLHMRGWSESEIQHFFTALSFLPPPIPLAELAEALGWPSSQVNSAAADLAPMLEVVRHGAIFRDEPTETYIKDHYSENHYSQQSIAERLSARQRDSVYAAESLPYFLVAVGDTRRAYNLASSNHFPGAIQSEHGRRALKLTRSQAAFSLAVKDKDFDKILHLTMQLAQLASANARGDEFIRKSPALATILGDTDISRRLFIDRFGWRGARDTRLAVAYSLDGELNEARIHQDRAIGWINWYLTNTIENDTPRRPGPEASDIASVLFVNVQRNDFSTFNTNIKLWRHQFALSVVYRLITLCEQDEISNKSTALQDLVAFAVSGDCSSIILQVGLLSKTSGTSPTKLRAISRSASALAKNCKEPLLGNGWDREKLLGNAISDAALVALITNSRQSAKRLLRFHKHRKPSSYDYGEKHYPSSGVWLPVQSACIGAWASGTPLALRHLVPKDVKTTRANKWISSEADLEALLAEIKVMDKDIPRQRGQKPLLRERFSRYERDDIVKGAACILKLVKPIETAVLSKKPLHNDALSAFLGVWKSTLSPGIHWNARTGRDTVARVIGLGLAEILLRHCVTVEKQEAKELIATLSENRFPLNDKLRVFALIARRENLADITGLYAGTLSSDIKKDEYIEQRGDSYRDLAEALLPMSKGEAEHYYVQGLAELDQMGGNDHELIFSTLHYGAEQPGGCLKPELSHRLMNLCQAIFQHEPTKFGWTLFGRAAGSSIGLSALNKLVRWHDQDVAVFSYGAPQLACYLAKAGHLDPRRAAIILAICEDHGGYDWKIGDGLAHLLSAAQPKDRAAIFSLIKEKLENEYAFGGWESIWESMARCIESFDEIKAPVLRSHYRDLREAARSRQDLENARNNQSFTAIDHNFEGSSEKSDKENLEKAFQAIVANCDPTTAPSIDGAIRDIRENRQLPYDSEKRLFREVISTCPYNDRLRFLQVLCESTVLDFSDVLNLMLDGVELWRDTTSHVTRNVSGLVERLFQFKGSELFNSRYSGVSREISRASKLTGNVKFVLNLVGETIAKERLELSGDEWLQLATSFSQHTKSLTALRAFEKFLASSTAKVGDEIGEGAYQSAFAGKKAEADIFTDIIWHMLGNDDAFVRWHTARSLKGMAELGLVQDIACLLERFDEQENPSLSSDKHYFSYLNAQQWLLMGLSRAAAYYGDKLGSLKPKLEILANRSDVHLLNKLHIARCLKHIEGLEPMSDELSQLFNEIENPPHGIVERDFWPNGLERHSDFRFDYEFYKYKVSSLARLFAIPESEAADHIAAEVVKRHPGTKSMDDIPGGITYQRGDVGERYETYRDHVQKHAYLDAAKTLFRNKPVVRATYYWGERNPWKDFLKENDVSFNDGSWQSDHKDRIPAQALKHLLDETKGKQKRLLGVSELTRAIGFSENCGEPFLPLSGYWTSPDGVHVRLRAAIAKERGALGNWKSFSKAQYHDFWLPSLGSDGRVDRSFKKSIFQPLVWRPEAHQIGIDEGDEWAARGTVARPRLGLAITKVLGLSPDKHGREWYDERGVLVLRSMAWGMWKPDHYAHQGQHQDNGEILLVQLKWLNAMLDSFKKSLVFAIGFEKYESRTSYDNNSGVSAQYFGLKRAGEPLRFSHAKNASRPSG